MTNMPPNFKDQASACRKSPALVLTWYQLTLHTIIAAAAAATHTYSQSPKEHSAPDAGKES
jgi:hypothetical protein